MPWDPEIVNMDPLHLLWFKAQIEADIQEKQRSELAITEYLAGFINPKALNQIRNSRDNAHYVPDDDLVRALQSISGFSKEKVLQNLSQKPRG